MTYDHKDTSKLFFSRSTAVSHASNGGGMRFFVLNIIEKIKKLSKHTCYVLFIKIRILGEHGKSFPVFYFF